jgi:6-phosphogluconolactonase (cycloisomerase 2 family)
MTILYVATSKNRLKAIEVDNKTGEFVRLVQDIDPIVQRALTTGDEETNNLGDDSRGNGISTKNIEHSVSGSGFLGSYSSSGTATTEWIERHPTFDSLLYVFTSFWNRTSAVVTTYRILGVNNHSMDSINTFETRSRGRLKKLGSVQTKGLHVSHVTFSPDHYSFVQNGNGNAKHKKPPSTICVGHYMDGSLSFFDCSRDVALGEPIRVVTLPEVRPETRNTTYPNPLPSIHHVTYNPRPTTINVNNAGNKDDDADDELCKYLLVSDTSKQGRVWTFAVDSIGLPISNNPVSFRKVTYITPPSGWLTRILTGGWVAGLADYRIRRCVVHPYGRYVYMLLEFNTVIQVYEINPFTGRISGDCLQEIPAIDPEYYGWKKTTGAAISAAAELYATATEVFVSNRGFNFWGGSAESSVRVFSIEDNGAKLVPKQSLECEGPVRHFLPECHRLCSEMAVTSSDNHFSSSPATLFVGSGKGRRRGTPEGQSGSAVNANCSASVETFVRRDPEAVGGTFERVGIIDVGMDDITCIAMIE